MSSSNKKHKSMKSKWLFKYRVVIMNENTLEDVATFRLNRLNVFVYSCLFAILMIVLTTLVIIYTPLRQYILGFSEAELKQKVVHLTFEMDSLQQKITGNEVYFQSIQKVLNGDIKPEKLDKDSLWQNAVNKSVTDFNLNIDPSEEEIKLRNDVAEEERYSIFDVASSSKKNLLFFTPLKGAVSNTFKTNEKHFGVDVVAQQGTPVMSVANGTVIFSEWSVKTGFVIIIEHENNFISIYKHNASLTKKQGDFVKAGEVIATVGNTGELSTGTHLHFELWNNGYPVDPFNYMNFK